MVHDAADARRAFQAGMAAVASGQAEHAVIWIHSEGDDSDGYTIEVEPLSGAVKLHNELIDWEDSYDFVPDEAPDLPT